MAETKLTITTNAQQVITELKQVSDGLKDVNKAQLEVSDTAKQTATGYEKTVGAIKDAQKASQSIAMTAREQADWDKKALQNQMDMYTKVQRVRKDQLTEEKGLIKSIEEEIKKYNEAWQNAKTPDAIAKTRVELDKK